MSDTIQIEMPARPGYVPGDFFPVTVSERTELSRDILGLSLAAPAELTWTPGAHIDVFLAEGMLRQYSLYSDPADAGVWRIAILRETAGRGGSVHAHEKILPGDTLWVRGPKNHFEAHPEARHHRFIAGGIGITPILPMVHAARAAGADWSLLYLGSHRDRMAFAEELERLGDRVQIHAKHELGTLDLAAALAQPLPGQATFACGPERLLAALATIHADGAHGPLSVEDFGSGTGAETRRADDHAFTVETDAGEVLVGADESILQALNRVGVQTLSSCGKGTCGTCETPVLEGTPDHRDEVLDEQERESGETMMICVSRCLGARLKLDL